MYAKIEGRRKKVAKELAERQQQLKSELGELEEAEAARAQESAKLEEALDARVEARRVEARAKGEARRVERAKAKGAHVEEKRHFNVEMDVMAEQMELELEEFEREESQFEEAIKARRMREIQEETARMQQLVDSERTRMQEALRTAQLLAHAKTEAENRARDKAQRRLEREQQRLKLRLEMEAQAERARMQVRCIIMAWGGGAKRVAEASGDGKKDELTRPIPRRAPIPSNTECSRRRGATRTAAIVWALFLAHCSRATLCRSPLVSDSQQTNPPVPHMRELTRAGRAAGGDEPHGGGAADAARRARLAVRVGVRRRLFVHAHRAGRHHGGGGGGGGGGEQQQPAAGE